MREKKWIYRKENIDNNIILTLAKELNISTLLATLLVVRGIETEYEGRAFLNRSTNCLNDPFLLNDMEEGVSRIIEAINAKEKITIFGDYDVDGVTSTATLYTYLKNNGAEVDFYIPDRMKEGYGISLSAIHDIAQNGTKLIITVDCGITALEELQTAADLGVDVIVTDHHTCGEVLPNAIAVINPKREDSTYPFKELSGVGVVFKVICAIQTKLGLELDNDFFYQYIDLVAIGTIADVMPVVEENRIIIGKGLEVLQGSRKTGVKALFAKSGLFGDKKITSGTIGYTIAPRINAAGRVGCAKRAVNLFLTEENTVANALATELCEENQNRQRMESQIMEEALQMLKEEEFSSERDRIVVLAREEWHHGIIGIVASRISEIHNCPVILLSIADGMAKGSGRSIKGFNLYNALLSATDLLSKFGGHELAAGVSLDIENLAKFKQRIVNYARQNLDLSKMVHTIKVDTVLEGEDITVANVKQLTALEPYGVGNSMPVFKIENVQIIDIMPISDDKHIRMTVKKGEKTINGFIFSTKMVELPVSRGDFADLVCNVDINTYKGLNSVQFTIKDIKLSKSQLDKEQNCYKIYKDYFEGQKVSKDDVKIITPDREDFVAVYRYIKQGLVSNMFVGNTRSLNRNISWHTKRDINCGKMFVCIDVLKEFNIFDYTVKDWLIEVILKDGETKINLNNSDILKKIKTY